MRNLKAIHTISSHVKSISQLKYQFNSLISSGLDGFIHIYDLKDFTVKVTLPYNNPILSFSVSEDKNNLSVGMLNSKLVLKNRQVEIKKEDDTEYPFLYPDLHQAPVKKQEFLKRGMSSRISEGDINVNNKKKRKLAKYEKHLKNFEYHLALDSSLKTKDPKIILSVIEELQIRGGLKIALQGRTEPDLILLLQFITKNLCDPYYFKMILYIINILIELYSDMTSESNEYTIVFNRILRQVEKEREYMEEVKFLEYSR